MSLKTFAIIGGGAAGIFAALSAAERKQYKEIIVFEASSSLLQKVKISGGGRCNVTHNCFDPEALIQNYPRGKQFLKRLFYEFQPQDTVEWFQKRGVKLKTEADGRMFPITDSSQTIIDCFLHEIKKHTIQIRYNSRITHVKKSNDQFILTLHDNTSQKCDALLIATGSSKVGYTLAESLGHSQVDTVPSLFTFKISDKRLKDISGVSCNKVTAKLHFKKSKYQQTGPLLITHWGLSGPAILKLSAFAAKELHDNKYKTDLKIDFVPEISHEKLLHFLTKSKDTFKQKLLTNIHPFEFPKSLWKNLLEHLSIPSQTTWGTLSKKDINKICEELTNSTFQVEGKGVFKDEFVTCGGISLKEVDSKSMQSKLCNNLFFAGEVLDIDGITGGFNFQSAWTTGYIVGKSV